MSTAEKNAAILIAHYGSIGAAHKAAGISDPTFRKARRGEAVQWRITVKLRKAVEAIRTDEDRRQRIMRLEAELQRAEAKLHQPPRNEATLEELVRFRDELFSLVARLSPNSHAQVAS